jgi:predicted deacylase
MATEYTSIIALEKLIETLNPTEISGTVIVVPLINIQSFEQKVPHVNPVDKKSMNRFYPGKIDGTQTERASYLITKQVVEQCDHLIDLHRDLDESLRPYSYWTRTGNEKQDQVSREMVLAFGLDHIIISTDRPKDPQASTVSGEHGNDARQAPDYGRGRIRGHSRNGRSQCVDQWRFERYALFENAARPVNSCRAPGLDR